MSQTEHHGSEPSCAFDDDSGLIGVEHFDHGALDDPIEVIYEAIAQRNPDARQMISDMVAEMIAERTADAIGRLLEMVASGNDPRRAAVELGIAAGIQFAVEKSGPKWAAEFGIKKQALHQSVRRIQQKLGLPKTRTMRSEAGCAAMAKAYQERNTRENPS